jgi:hypothetical protein
MAEHVEDMALDLIADRHRNRRPGVGHRSTPHQPIRRLHGDSPHGVVTEILGDLEGHRLA